ncbi:MAG TPA: DUF1080 domain-containing protein [Daejeonella sp.]|nr:DUF1080 domain-containing protein [Daejeonella sp.]
MRKSLFILSIAVLALGCGSTKSTDSMSKSSDNPSEGFVPLFDGKSLENWHTYGQATAGSAWKVEDGSLYLDADNKVDGKIQGGGDLVTNEEFDNFHLKLEWKVSPKGNSGIIFYVHEDTTQFKNTYNTGPEMQVLDNAGHADAKIHKHRAGDLYDLIAGSSEPVKPAGEWNLAEIISDNGKLTFKLNGTEIVSTTLWDDNWRAMLAGSKFATMNGFGTYKSGKIALQDHGDKVWYRNIMIKKL